ncbi:WD40-repeat-containing domain protein [Ganoderma leucocontextum]|nr:WD40-repeat-containing domain protein [Ganoderma leucocontextum]
MRYEKTAAVSDDSGHSGGVAAVAFSPNDMLLASAGLDHKVCIWRTSNGQLMHTFVAASAVLSLAWVLSQCLLLCGTQDGSVLALSVTQSQLHAISFPRSHNFPVEHLAAHGDRLASGSHEELAIWERTDGTPAEISTFNVGQWKHLLDLPQPPKNSTNEDSEVLVTSIHWTRSKDHSSILLVTYLYHGYVIYDTRGWRRLLTTPLNGYIASASITADGQKLVVSNMASGFDIYETATGNSLGTLNHAVGRVFAVPVLFVHGGNAVIAGSTVGEVHLWNVSTLRLHQILRLNGVVTSCIYRPSCSALMLVHS